MAKPKTPGAIGKNNEKTTPTEDKTSDKAPTSVGTISDTDDASGAPPVPKETTDNDKGKRPASALDEPIADSVRLAAFKAIPNWDFKVLNEYRIDDKVWTKNDIFWRGTGKKAKLHLKGKRGPVSISITGEVLSESRLGIVGGWVDSWSGGVDSAKNVIVIASDGENDELRKSFETTIENMAVAHELAFAGYTNEKQSALKGEPESTSDSVQLRHIIFEKASDAKIYRRENSSNAMAGLKKWSGDTTSKASALAINTIPVTQATRPHLEAIFNTHNYRALRVDVGPQECINPTKFEDALVDGLATVIFNFTLVTLPTVRTMSLDIEKVIVHVPGPGWAESGTLDNLFTTKTSDEASSSHKKPRV